jgi:hypothetical protein
MPNYFPGGVQIGPPGPQGPPATNPLSAEGDILYQHSGVQAALPIGIEGDVLVSTGTDPQWQTAGNVAVGSLNALQGAVLVVSTSELKINTGAPSGQDIQVTGNGLSVTIATAALTALGTQGSMTFTRGVLTSQTAAT